MEPLIELAGISLAFGDKRVFDDLDLRIERGQTTVIVGRSGSGKTLLLKLMMGLATPDRGNVRVFGRDLAMLSARERVDMHRRMGMLFQSYALFDALDVQDNVAFPLREGVGAPRRDAEHVSRELIRVLGLAGNEHVLPGELSGGMRKRVGLARALAAHPEIVLLDEPTTGLDPLNVEQVDRIIDDAKRRYAITVVVISHDLASVRRLADRVAFLHEGKIAFTGTYDEFIHSTLPPIRTFLGDAPHATARATRRDDEPVIELVGVHKRFGGKHVLRGIDLAIYPGRITALIGSSGSGKTVIARHIMGLLSPDRGKVLAFGTDLATLGAQELQAMRRRFGFVFQHSALLDWLSVEDNVAFPLVEGRHEPGHAARGRVDDVLERLGLTALRHRMPAELSAGERKRVALARAIVVQPDVLIYDEPTTGQDPQRAHEIDTLIVETQQRFDVTTIVISHDMQSTFRIAHAIALVHDGKIAAYGTPAELSRSSDPYVQHFIEASAA